MNIFHISDLHYNAKNIIGTERIERIFTNIKSQDISPDILLITGDIKNRDYSDYRPIFKMIEQQNIPFYCITGNHDNSSELIKYLSEYAPKHPRSEHENKLDYVVDEYPLRIIALDSFKENISGGELTELQLAWLEEKLINNPKSKPTLIMIHQFTAETGMYFSDVSTKQPWCDKFNDIISRYKENIKLVACGHLHNSLISNIDCVPIISSFSCSWQAHLDFNPIGNMQEPERPVGYYIHRWNNNKMISYAVALT